MQHARIFIVIHIYLYLYITEGHVYTNIGSEQTFLVFRKFSIFVHNFLSSEAKAAHNTKTNKT